MSFIRNVHVNHIKRTAPKVKANLKHFATEYLNGTSILTLAKEANYPPFLFARFMVEHLTSLPKNDVGAAVTHPGQYLTDVSVLRLMYRQDAEAQQKPLSFNSPFSTQRLAQEIHEAAMADPLCGPRHDVARRMVGVEFEVVLEHQLSDLGKHFWSIGTLARTVILFLAPLNIFQPTLL